MFSFAMKNLWIKKVQMILIIISIMISAGVALLSFNISNQISDGLITNSQYHSLVIGPSGSDTQLTMNTLFFTDEPVGTIPYSVKEKLEMDSRVRQAIPFAMADQYNGFRMVGTSSPYLDGKKLSKGEMFSDSEKFQVVVGYEVARACDLSIGEQIYTSHSQGEEHHTPFTVTGIIERTYSSFDNVCFTELQSIWAVHEEEEGEEEEEEHEEMNGMVTAIVVDTINPAYAMMIQNEYKGKVITEMVDGSPKSFTLSAVEPMAVMRNVIEDTDQTKYIVYAFSAIVLFMNLIIISLITLLNMHQSEKDIKLMRLIGISMPKINALYLIQNLVMGAVSIVLAFLISKLGLLALSGYAASMGVVVNVFKSYWLEFVILLAVFAISVLPTFIWINIKAKKEVIK